MKVSANVKMAMQRLEIFGGGDAPWLRACLKTSMELFSILIEYAHKKHRRIRFGTFIFQTVTFSTDMHNRVMRVWAIAVHQQPGKER